MTHNPVNDPRTVARNIPGVFDSLFPQLTPSIVAHFNRTAQVSLCAPIPIKMVQESKLLKAMLFELGFTVGEKQLAGNKFDWDDCLRIAIARQKRYFDAQVPSELTKLDKQVAEMTGNNIATMIKELAAERKHPIRSAPAVSGFQWISSGHGDFAIGPTLIEVKCSSGNFSAPDYRQIVMYWLLSFSASVEDNRAEWSEGILLNPRSAKYVAFELDDFLRVISGGRTKVEILQLFSSMVGTRDVK
ncbi:conserved hypothetical protein [Candidatus Nitrotoga sp. BS]|uniref:hypothetical protein n=1 Tax=Candidatus Nitrotoga sp. BS TaxID=2890408 RepID=UPI001EF2C89E|nr:hypothetical protein [Candidatus Nitrotoga sp. BS]CAH1188947.1 conserved hypothetical protein [Candidatus Nitrotoga sp. BS]